MGLSVWAGMHEAKSTGEPTKPCQSLLIRLGLNAMPKEMSVFYTLGFGLGVDDRMNNQARTNVTPTKKNKGMRNLSVAGLTKPLKNTKIKLSKT